MTNWVFSDESGESVHRVLPSGVYESTTADNIEGVTPEPYVKSGAHVIGDLVAQLSAIDAESVRPLRAKLAGSSTEDDDDKLAALDLEAAGLRKELRGMTT